MGKRREPRKQVELPVRIFGTDSAGRVFSENATAIDISQHGARLRELKIPVKPEEIIGLCFGKHKVHFRVKWAGEAGTPREGQVGLESLNPEKPLWDTVLPLGATDSFTFNGRDRRQSARVKCSISVELHPPASSVIWGKASDLSTGGCFVEMAIPLKEGTAFEIALWLGSTKLRLRGEVASFAAGFGIGVRFMNVSAEAKAMLKRHIATLS